MFCAYAEVILSGTWSRCVQTDIRGLSKNCGRKYLIETFFSNFFSL